MKRLTQNEAEKRFRARGLTLLSEYRGNHENVLVGCSCGNRFCTSPLHVFSGHTQSCGCYAARRVAETKRLSHAEVTKRFGRRELTLLSEYEGGRKPVKVRCRCGQVFEAVPKDVFAGAKTSCGCLHKVTQQDAAFRFAARNLVLLSVYRESESVVRARCHCGRVFRAVPARVFAGRTTSCGCARLLRQDDAERRFTRSGLKMLSEYRGQKTRVKARCRCGKLFVATPASVFNGNTRSCGCLKTQAARSRRRDLSRQRFGRLVAIERTGANSHGQSLWKCLCDCGRHTIVPFTALVGGGTQSCGCGQKVTGADRFNWKGRGEVSGNVMSALRWKAKSRRLRLSVSAEDCWQLFLKQKRRCALSGVALSLRSESAKGISASLDRIDSNGGYVSGNVQWIHKILNRMKSDLPQKRFIELCRLVARRIGSKKRAAGCVITPKHWTFKGHGNIGRDYWSRIRSGTRLGNDERLKRDISFRITIEDAWRKFLEQNGRCALTGLALDWDSSRGPRGAQVHYRGSASLDRIDSQLGYEKGNIQWVHKEINAMKSDMNEAEFKMWCRRVARHIASPGSRPSHSRGRPKRAAQSRRD